GWAQSSSSPAGARYNDGSVSRPHLHGGRSMRRPRSSWRRTLSLLALAPLLLAVAFAQGQGKKPPEEEDTPKKPPMTGKKPPEEEGNDTKPDKVIRVDDPRSDPARTPVAQGNVDLAPTPRKATHPHLKALYNELAIPHALFEIGNQTTGYRSTLVRPVPEFVGALPGSKKITVKVIDKTGKDLRQETVAAAAIRDPSYYELL